MSSPLCNNQILFLERKVVGVVGGFAKIGNLNFGGVNNRCVGHCGSCASLNAPCTYVVVPTTIVFACVDVERYCHLVACLNVEL